MVPRLRHCFSHGRFRLSAAVASIPFVAALTTLSAPAQAIDIPNVGGETMRVLLTNTSEVAYRFDNRDDNNAGTNVLVPQNVVNDNYLESYNRLYARVDYWKFRLGVRLDSAVYALELDRQGVQDLVQDRLGEPGNLSLENRLNQELHSRYTDLIYPAKLNLRFKHKRFEATLGDFYVHLGRGMVFSVRKIDELGVDTTVRGAKVKGGFKAGGVNVQGMAFAGQLNPLRIDVPNGRILHGDGSALFFGFPKAGAFPYFEATGNGTFEERLDPPIPSYLEDTVVGGNVTVAPSFATFEANATALFRKSNSRENAECVRDGGEQAFCASEFPVFRNPESTRSHDRIITYSGAVRIPPIENIFDAYIEVAGQHQQKGQFSLERESGDISRLPGLSGYGIYANVNLHAGPASFTIEGKHYQRFFPLGANIDLVNPGTSAPEYSIVFYSRPPTIAPIYTQFLGSPDICMTGGRVRTDVSLSDDFKLYGWGGYYQSLTEANPINNECKTTRTVTDQDGIETEVDAPELTTNTVDLAAGTDFKFNHGQSHYIVWVGARDQQHIVPVASNVNFPPVSVFYREAYIRYDITQHLTGDFSISALGFHQRRYEPAIVDRPWHEGENLLSLNYNPHWSFIFGVEYLLRPGFPDTYFNGAVQYRAKADEHWYDMVFNTATAYVGQRRSALRCIGGVCRLYPAFEGARVELVSVF